MNEWEVMTSQMILFEPYRQKKSFMTVYAYYYNDATSHEGGHAIKKAPHRTKTSNFKLGLKKIEI